MVEKKEVSGNCFAVVSQALANAAKLFSKCINNAWWACKAVTYTLINSLIWFVDKIVLGPPCIRTYLKGGVFPSGFSENRQPRRWMRKNSGYDIYNKLYNGAIDNLLGIVLGCFSGIFPMYTLVNHAVKSFCSVLKNNYDYASLTSAGARRKAFRTWYYECGRHDAWVIVGNIFSFYISLPIIIVTNLVLGYFKSLWAMRPMLVMFNYKWIDTKEAHCDRRPLLTQIVSGFFSTLTLLPISIPVNIIYGVASSIWYMLPLAWQFLNRTRKENKALWKKDSRNLAAKLFFGAVINCCCLPITIITNSIYGGWLSIMAMINAFVPEGNTYTATTLYERIKRELSHDDRHWFVKGLFTVITSPLAALIITGSHAYHSLKTIWHLLGKFCGNDPDAAHLFQYRWVSDGRPSGFKWLGVIASAPVWVPVFLITNLVLGGYYSLRNQLKIWHSATNNPQYNIRRVWEEDQRLSWVKYVFGFLTFPIWVTVSIFTNPVIGCWQTLRHEARRWWGIVEPLDPEKDDQRPRVSRIGYGVASCWLWIPMHIIIASSVVVAVILSPFVFVFRKSFGTMYTAIRRACAGSESEVSLVRDGLPHNNYKTFVKGLVGLVTFGLAPILAKIFKRCEFFPSHRFDCVNKFILCSASKHSSAEKAGKTEGNGALISISRIFNGALRMARSGTFMGKDWMGRARFIGRMAGMRSRVEKIIKLFHNAFIVYASGDYVFTTELSKENFEQCRFFKEARSQALVVSNNDNGLVNDVLRELQLTTSVV